MANMYKNKSSRPPILVRAGNVYVNVSIITLICFALCTNLRTLEIRRARMKVVEAPKSSSIVSEIMLEMIEVTTITKSKMLP